MFALRFLGVTLAFFLAQYCLLSVLVARGWRLAARPARALQPRLQANYLLVLRLLPLVIALASTALFVAPSYLLLEPREAHEAVGNAPVALSICCILLICIGLRNALRAQARSSRAVAEWMCESTPNGVEQSIPIYRIRPAVPALTVAGVCAPRVLVSNAAASLLDAPEMNTALRHEMAHVRYRDNLKKLFFRFTAFPGMAALESAWTDASEMAADDAAVSDTADALNLASAIIKLSRLGPTSTEALAAGLVHGSGAALNARVERLVTWQRPSAASPASWLRLAIPIAAATCVAIIASYPTVLAGMHEATEWLVR
jgi:Zn-dependent protease with chaperone function